jgi:hypothetical protein
MKAAEKFKTYYDLIQDEKFLSLLQERIESIADNRQKLKAKAQKGSVWEKGSFDILKEKGMMNPEALRDECIKISEKRSELKPKLTEWIDAHCMIVIGQTIRYYDDLDESEKKPFTIMTGGHMKENTMKMDRAFCKLRKI